MRSILEHVQTHARLKPNLPCATLVSRRAGDSPVSWAQVVCAAERSAAALARIGVKRGDVVVLIGTHDANLHGVWLGVVWLGAVPTILAEPSVRVDRGIYWSRLAALLRHVNARVVATSSAVETGAVDLGGTTLVRYSELTAARGGAPRPVEARPEDLVLLQHSSGTTGLQKGVMLTHGAVMQHARAYADAIGVRGDDVVASWLPLYHDMGFIACFVDPLIEGTQVIWLSPFEWVLHPRMLLEAVTRYRATLLWLPNFAHRFMAERIRSLEGLDLSTLRLVVNCSEPVTPEAVAAFSSRFAEVGLDPEALQACYAMAENVFAVTTTNACAPPRWRRIDAVAWRERHEARPIDEDASAPVVHISNGLPIAGCDVRILGDEGRPVAPATAGRIAIKSAFLFEGYFERPDLRLGLFDDDGYFDTGDIGYLDEDGHLFVTGRRKDPVIIGGRNIYPTDVEEIVNQIDGVHPGRVVCFGVPMKALATEGVVVLAESDHGAADWPAIVSAIRRAVPQALDIDLADARILERGRLRKSTSGKLARGGNREWYLEGRFDSAAKPMAARARG